MRPRLRKTNRACGRVVIGRGGPMVSVRFDGRAPMESRAYGAPVKWEREEERTDTFTLSADGRTLTLNVVVRSPRLPRLLTYKLVYNRAS